MATWVLLRGLMRDKRHWNGFDQRLRQRGFRVVTPDLPGNGELYGELSPLNIADYGAAVWQQLEEQGAVPQSGIELTDSYRESGNMADTARVGDTNVGPIYLLGLSMGGMVALEMARQRPVLIKHLVLLNSSAANLSPWYHRFNLINSLTAFLLRRRGDRLHPIESTIIRLTSCRHQHNNELIAHWSQLRGELKPKFNNALRQLWAAFKYQCPDALKVPVSVLCGDRDSLVNIKASNALARHYKLEPIVLAYCGHDVTIDAPAKLAHCLANITSGYNQGEPSIDGFAGKQNLLEDIQGRELELEPS
ncbi:alpha/beta fold hydrolase [Shewanella acanthi]|uniref:alpha/beta fold hydrolase n=1 Tax=Shewanella acanthi TaxID=2864212 RepID=UPI001C661012|nr:alpha/beta hydrolase [Shewanella acanthi]QYJ77558.1 alpha/beta hydrolase [Shewanella acanthi]